MLSTNENETNMIFFLISDKAITYDYRTQSNKEKLSQTSLLMVAYSRTNGRSETIIKFYFVNLNVIMDRRQSRFGR